MNNINKLQKKWIFLLVLLMLFSLSSCTTPPPRDPNNICSIFQQYPKWYWAAQDVQKKWGLPISVLMAVMHQESRFNAAIKPPRGKLLGFIPWFRPTSAYGYAQVLDDTWRSYQKATGNRSANRNNFYDAVDFIGWYANQAHKRVGIKKGDAYRVYLAYHEGIGGYKRGSYKKKKWLIDVAKKVDSIAWRYHGQLKGCMSSLPSRPWYHPWSYI